MFNLCFYFNLLSKEIVLEAPDTLINDEMPEETNAPVDETQEELTAPNEIAADETQEGIDALDDPAEDDSQVRDSYSLYKVEIARLSITRTFTETRS